MESKHGLCCVCGRQTDWEELQPVKLVRESDGVILGGACGGCLLDVDACARLNRKRVHEEYVMVNMGGKEWRVVRR